MTTATLLLDALPLAAASISLRRQRPPDSAIGLGEFIPRTSPRYERPDHLRELVEALEQAENEPVRLVVSTPPRHGKTETLLHYIPWSLTKHPDRTHGYATYATDLALSKSRKARWLAQAAGVALASDAQALHEWRTPQGGGLLATGAGGPLTGHGISGTLIVDDPIKNRVEAESALMRERTWEWFNDVAFTRLEPGASAIVVAARWHPDDLSGRLIEQGWREIKLPAISDDGAALWPSRWPVIELEKIHTQVGEYTWASLYQGRPRPRGGAVFRDVNFYDALPEGGYREGIGLDFAYTAKKRSDYSVAVHARRYGDTLYILDVQRFQIESPQFAARVRFMRESAPVARLLAFISGIEHGTIDFFRVTEKLPITAVQAVEDKFVRSQPVAALWNAGRVLVPKTCNAAGGFGDSPPPWLTDFITEICGFTGVNDLHDDQVDALAGAERATSGAGFGAWE